jgi:two-component system sensor histidine kinase VicK
MVSDTGIGIPPEDITLIFDKFHRASHSKMDETEGTGLGLAIARQIVEQFGGEIWATSTQGSGSTFTFTLPLAGNVTPAEGKDR